MIKMSLENLAQLGINLKAMRIMDYVSDTLLGSGTGLMISAYATATETFKDPYWLVIPGALMIAFGLPIRMVNGLVKHWSNEKAN